jgi:hypothetical protein
MEKWILILLILSIMVFFICGCISKAPDVTSSAMQPGNTPDSVDAGRDSSTASAQPSPLSADSKSNVSEIQNSGNVSSAIPINSPVPLPLEDFISTSFSEVTDLYNSIKKSRNALAWKEVQDKALQMQLLIQEYKKSYRLDLPNPEKKVFGRLNSREEIVLLKYLQYLNDMEGYAVNLKNAVYYQEKGSDSESAQTALRYQSHADQNIKRAIAEVKTISDYCNDFKFSFFDSELVSDYRYTS